MARTLFQRVIGRVFDTKPPPFSRYLIPNLLGWQPVRTLLLHVRFWLRPKRPIPAPYRQYLEDFERDGYAIIPNFLSPDEYARFRAEYIRLIPEFQQDASKVELPHADRLDLRDPRVSDETRKLFLESSLIMSVARSFLRRKKLYEVNGYFTRIYALNQAEVDAPQNGGTNNLHIDSPFRIMKAFYYVDSVDEKNGAFAYVRGTQKRSLRQLWLEYRLSIRYALNKYTPNPEGQYMPGDSWVTVSDKDIERYRLKTKPVAAPGNTLVLGNPAGWHRRGNFLEPGERRTVEINFRNVDTLKNYLKSLFD